MHTSLLAGFSQDILCISEEEAVCEVSFGRRGGHYRSAVGRGARHSDGTVDVAWSPAHLSNGPWSDVAGVKTGAHGYYIPSIFQTVDLEEWGL